MQGFFPPSSSVTLFRLLWEAASLTSFPTFRIKTRPHKASDTAGCGPHILDKPGGMSVAWPGLQPPYPGTLGLDAVPSLPCPLPAFPLGSDMAGIPDLSCSTYWSGWGAFEGSVTCPRPHSWLVVELAVTCPGACPSQQQAGPAQGTKGRWVCVVLWYNLREPLRIREIGELTFRMGNTP